MTKLDESQVPDVLILCGGQGKRFREVREDIPKALAPINGVPFLDLQLNDLVTQGCNHIILGTGYMGELIEAHVKKRQDADYLISQENQPLGTGGAIRQALHLVQSDNLLVLNGDSQITFSVHDILEFHKTKQAEVTMLLSSATQGRDYGNVELENNELIVSFQEKPTKSFSRLISAGIYCIQSSIIQQKNHGTASLEIDWLPKWVKKKEFLAW